MPPDVAHHSAATLTALCAFVSFQTLHLLDFFPGLAELCGLFTLIGLLHCGSLLYVKKWTIRIDEHNDRRGDRGISWLQPQCWKIAYKVTNNPRLVNLPRKYLVIPEENSRARSAATHKNFSIVKAKWLALNTLLYILVLGVLVPIMFVPLQSDDFATSKTTYLRRMFSFERAGSGLSITKRETLLRVWFTTNSLWTPLLLLDGTHLILAVTSIYVLRIDTPMDWPELFGHPLEAYTLAKFWTRYACHQVYKS
ncbi:hypothetical protein LTS08_005996 [Lithohypha guttulata]|nr:hypothetical protein LTS08_005996 [Lithohypha guttulata]